MAGFLLWTQRQLLFSRGRCGAGSHWPFSSTAMSRAIGAFPGGQTAPTRSRSRTPTQRATTAAVLPHIARPQAQPGTNTLRSGLAAGTGRGLEARILQVRQDIIEAVVWRRAGRLALLAKQLLRLEVNSWSLAATGIGILANDSSVWPDTDSKDWARRAADKWRAMIIEAKATPPEDCLQHQHARKMTKHAPFRGLRAGDFVTRLDALEKDLLEVDPCPPPTSQFRGLAAKVLLHGFARVGDFDGLTCDEIEEMGNTSWEKALLVRALQKTQVAALRKRASWAHGVLNPRDAPSHADGAQFVHNVTPFKADSAWSEIAKTLEATSVASHAGPAKSVAQLMKAKLAGVDVLGQLDQRAFLSRLAFLEPSSIPALCSGIRCWHFFACGVLNYLPSHTLPPKRSLDV